MSGFDCHGYTEVRITDPAEDVHIDFHRHCKRTDSAADNKQVASCGQY